MQVLQQPEKNGEMKKEAGHWLIERNSCSMFKGMDTDPLAWRPVSHLIYGLRVLMPQARRFYTYIAITQTLHVWYIYIHWRGLRGQCRHIWQTWSVWVILIGLVSPACRPPSPPPSFARAFSARPGWRAWCQRRPWHCSWRRVVWIGCWEKARNRRQRQ